MPMREAGRAAAAMIYDALDGTELTDLVVTDPAPRLVARASTSAVPDDPQSR